MESEKPAPVEEAIKLSSGEKAARANRDNAVQGLVRIMGQVANSGMPDPVGLWAIIATLMQRIEQLEIQQEAIANVLLPVASQIPSMPEGLASPMHGYWLRVAQLASARESAMRRMVLSQGKVAAGVVGIGKNQ